MRDIVIVAATRTAVGKFGGTLAKIPASDLGAIVIQELLKRARLSGEQIGDVILGQGCCRRAPDRTRHARRRSRPGCRRRCPR